MNGPIAILGCGNLNRSDDGAGVVAARQLADRLAPEIETGAVEVHDAGTNGFEVMYKARGAAALIVIDACKSGSEPGAIFEVPGSELEVAADPGINLHAFRWDHALWLSREILGDPCPDDVVAFLIEAATTEIGLELSPPVAAAVGSVVDRVCERLSPAARGGNFYDEALRGR